MRRVQEVIYVVPEEREEFLKKQGRFAHMFKKGNDWMIDEAQEYVDKQWDKLLAKCE